MQIYLDCYPCLLRQALNAARRVNASEEEQVKVMQNVLEMLKSLKPDATPPDIAYAVHRTVCCLTPSKDPYKEAKIISTAQALELYPEMKKLVAASADPLDTALRLSIAGNIIDMAVKDEFDDLWETVERVLQQDYAIDDSRELRARLAEADYLLYLADNAGETVFDRVLIETLELPVVYAVKGGPILNDATLEDALAAGLDKCAEIVSNGAEAPGTILSFCSEEFRRQFERAPLVIAKGQANYETLSQGGEKVYCLLQVKCPVIGKDIQAPQGSIVIRRSR